MLDSVHAVLVAVLAFFGGGDPAGAVYQGYAEGEYVLVASQVGGAVETVNVARGATAQRGQVLFTLEQGAERAALAQAQAQSARAEAALADLLKAKRQPELDALVAQRGEAQAALQLADLTFARDQKLLPSKAISQATLDGDRAALDQARARVDAAEAALASGKLSVGRDDAIRAAQADVAAARAALAQAQWRLDQKTLAAPAEGFVFDTLYRSGEYVAAGQPVVSLLPPSNIRARFFVSEGALGSVAVGMPVVIACNGCAHDVPAHVSYVSPQAEYTPPELYNRDNRARLLFMLEATPDATPEILHPGQPVDVRVVGKGHE